MLKNIYQNIPAELPEELIEILAQGQHVKIERIVSRGHRSPDGYWYDQDTHEFVILLQGRAQLTLAEDNQSMTLSPGDHLLIPAHAKHRVDWTDNDQDTIWLAVHWNDPIDK